MREYIYQTLRSSSRGRRRRRRDVTGVFNAARAARRPSCSVDFMLTPSSPNGYICLRPLAVYIHRNVLCCSSESPSCSVLRLPLLLLHHLSLCVKMARCLHHHLLPLAVALLAFAHLAPAYEFYVGGEEGWVVKPAERYDLWAERMRFQVNDTLVFKYRKGEDSVLVVSREDFKSCDTTNPIEKFDNGDTAFLLDRSGPFFFISGDADHCAQGQKLAVVVMAVRRNPAKPPTSPAPFSPHPSTAPAPPQVVAFSMFVGGVLALLALA